MPPAARHAIAAALAAALTLPGVARAEPTPPPPEELHPEEPAEPARPPADAPDYEAARKAYRSAEAAMARGDYATAARDFGIAYRQSRDPVLFFKIATAFQKAGDCHTAVVYYRRYLAEGNPDASFQARTEAEIAVCGAARPLPAPAPEPASSPTWQRPVAWTAVGMTAALVTAGVVLGMAARSRQSDIEELLADAGDQRFTGPTRAEYEDLVDEGERFETLSVVALSAAGVTAVVAVLGFVFADEGQADRRDTAGLRLSPTVSPEAAGLTAGWSF